MHIPRETVHNFRMRSRTATFVSLNSGVGAAHFFEAFARVIKHLIGGHAGVQLLDVNGLDRDEATHVAQWVIELMIGALRRGHGPTRKTSARRGT